MTEYYVPRIDEIKDLYDAYHAARQSRPKGKANCLLGKKGKSAELLEWERTTLAPINDRIASLFERMGKKPSPSAERFSHLYQLARGAHQKCEPFEGGFFLKDGEVHQIEEVLETRDCETLLQVVCRTDKSDLEYAEAGFIFSSPEGLEFYEPHWIAYLAKEMS